MLPKLQTAADRRIHARTPYAGTLNLQCAGEATWFPVHGLDVSAGGFAFFSESEMRRGERLAVAVPELEAYTVAAVVRHVEHTRGGFFVGIEFDEPLPAQLEHCLAG